MSDSVIKVGVVGLGMGRAHVQQYQQVDGCEVVAVCDMDEGKLHSAAHDFGISRTFTDMGEMFGLAASSELHAVSLATPNKFHAPGTIQALEAGLHVLCEKPMAMNAAEAQGMVDKATEKNLRLAIHFNHRMVPGVQWMSRFAHAGELGEVYFARTTWHRRKGIPARPSFLQMANSGGGGMIDLGVHMLDQTLFIMGYPKAVRVSAQTYTKFAEKDAPGLDMDVDDFAVALVRFENGATLELEIAWASHHDHPEEYTVQVYGTEGGARRVTRNYSENQFTISRRDHGGLSTVSMDKEPGDCKSVQQDFVEAIREGRDPICSGHHGLAMMKLLDAIYKSSREGREVEIG